MQFLNTKFHIPKVTDPKGLVPRPTLAATLDTSIEKHLTIIQAPAGFGKTTLLSQWIDESQMGKRVCWVSVDKADNHPIRFWSYVLESFNRALEGVCGNALFQLHTMREPGIEEVLITMINDLASLEQPVALILDDYHLIDNPQIDNQLSFLLDHPTDNFSIIVSTRKKPRIGLARMRVSGQLSELNASGLKFSQREMTDYLHLCSKDNLSVAQKKRLYKKTEGWVAAIKLATLTPGSPKISTPTQPGTRIHDYLMEEVFYHLPDGLKHFLLKISIIDRFNLSLCWCISQDPNTDAHLSNIHQHRLFLIPLDDEKSWYRFHHLFLNFLRSVLHASLSAEIQTLHTRAFKWFRENLFFEEAFDHALAAKREDLAADVFTEHISSLYGEGGEQPLYQYFEKLSQETILSNPILAGYYFGFQTYSGDFTIIPKMKRLYEKGFSKKDTRLFKGFYLSSKAYETFYCSGDLQKAIIQIQDAIDHLPKSHGAIIRMLEYMQIISFRYSGQIKQAMALCRSSRTDDILMAGMADTSRADLDLEMGHLKNAKNLIEDQIQVIESVFGSQMPPSMFGFVFILMGKILTQENRLHEAQDTFSKGIATIKGTDMIELVVISLGEYSVLLGCCREYKKALRTIDQAIQLARQNFSWVENLLLAQKNKIWLKQNKQDRVAPWADKYPVKKEMIVPFVQSMEYIVLARYFILCRQLEKAGFILDALIEKDIKDRRNGQLLECYVLKSKVLFQSGDLNAACDHLKKAFDISRNQGHVMVFIEDAVGMEQVYHHCLSQDELPKYLTPHLLFLNPAKKKDGKKQVIIHDFAEMLNARELSILKLFKQGLSNKETADRLCLSVNTVRWYASRLFAKLDVKRRGQAVSRAEALKLI